MGRDEARAQPSKKALDSSLRSGNQTEGARQGVNLSVQQSLLLTSLTLLSVSADAYDFVRAEQVIVSDRGERLRLVLEFVLGVCLLVAVVWYLVMSPRGKRRRR